MVKGIYADNKLNLPHHTKWMPTTQFQ